MSRAPGFPRRLPAAGSLRLLAAAALAACLVVGGSAAGVGAQEPGVPPCSGVVVDASIAAPSVPGGSWAVVDTCVPPEAVYEAELLGYRLVGGLGIATYTDGHLGRVAFVTATVAEDRALTLVGLEDDSTGLVTWAYADGSYASSGSTRTVGGVGDAATIPSGGAPGPVEAAEVQLGIDGTGTDLATATGPVPDQIRAFLDAAAAALSD